MSDLRCPKHVRIDGVFDECIPCLKDRLALLEKVAEEAREILWVFVCHCHPDYKRILRHEPNAICGEDEDLQNALRAYDDALKSTAPKEG